MREFELDVGTGLCNNLLIQNSTVFAVNDLVLDGGLLDDGLADIAGLHDVGTKLGHQTLQVRNELQTTIKISEDWVELANVDDGRRHQSEKVESHLLLGECTNAKLLDAFSDHVVAAHQTSTTSPTNDRTADGEVLAPVLRVPTVEESLQSKFGLGVQAIITKGTVVWRQGQYNLSRASFVAMSLLLGLDRAQKTEQVGQHDTVSKLRLGIDGVDLTAILGDGSEGNDIVQVPAKTLLGVVDVVNQSLNVLLAALVERHDHKLGTTGTVTGVHGLVVLGHLAREATGSDNDLGTTADQTLEDLGTNGTRAGTGHQNVLALEAETVLGSRLQNIQIDASQLLVVVPAVVGLLLQVQEWNSLQFARAGGSNTFGSTTAALLGVAVLLGNDLALIHAESVNDILVKCIKLDLRRLGETMLLANELVNTLQVVLNLGPVAVLGDRTSLSHVFDVMLKLASTGAGSFLVANVATGIDGCLGASRHSDVLVNWSHLQHFATVLNELLSKFLSQLVCLSALSWAVVNVILHEIEEEGVGAVHDADTLADNFAVDHLQATKDDIVIHAQGILTSPVPRGVVDTGLQRIERWLNTRGVEVAVLYLPQVQLSLQHFLVLLRCHIGLFTTTKVHLQVAGNDLKLLFEQSSLILGKGIDGCRVHDHATTATSSVTTSNRSRKVDSGVGGILVGYTVDIGLSIRFRCQTSRGLHGETEQEHTILAARSQTPPSLQVFSNSSDVEATGHFGGDHSGDERGRLFSKLSVECGLHRGTQLVEGNVLGLFGCRTEFLTQVTEDFIL